MALTIANLVSWFQQYANSKGITDANGNQLVVDGKWGVNSASVLQKMIGTGQVSSANTATQNNATTRQQNQARRQDIRQNIQPQITAKQNEINQLNYQIQYNPQDPDIANKRARIQQLQQEIVALNTQIKNNRAANQQARQANRQAKRDARAAATATAQQPIAEGYKSIQSEELEVMVINEVRKYLKNNQI